jgi:hypothetical protein
MFVKPFRTRIVKSFRNGRAGLESTATGTIRIGGMELRLLVGETQG